MNQIVVRGLQYLNYDSCSKYGNLSKHYEKKYYCFHVGNSADIIQCFKL